MHICNIHISAGEGWVMGTENRRIGKDRLNPDIQIHGWIPHHIWVCNCISRGTDSYDSLNKIFIDRLH